MDMVNAQQTRRLLDRIVGYKLSPLLSSKIQKGLSGGRVQSSTLKIVVDKEREIRAFVPQEYWSIDSIFNKNIDSTFYTYKNEKMDKLSITNEKDSKEIVKTIEKEDVIVSSIETKKRKTSTPPPFMTSTLQQTASSKLGLSPKRAMMLAQTLYEGVKTPNGTSGVITYMRTDSLNMATEAVEAAREVIGKRYGDKYLPKAAKSYVKKSKGAQEAHEAIRPTMLDFTPEIAEKFLKADELKLYALIYNRFLACQMTDAQFEQQSILFKSESSEFKANGRKLVFDGFYRVVGAEDKDKLLPVLKEGEKADLSSIKTEQHFTEPPSRYSEASLIKKLEAEGIGRPSTYASIISTLQNREYVEMDKRRFIPTDVGRVVNNFLTKYFTQYVDYDFTAHLEDDLDAVARGEKDWVPLMRDFWQPFKDLVDDTEKNVDRRDVTHEKIEEKCPKCGGELSIRLGRRGRFIGCMNYPECDYARNLNGDDDSKDAELLQGRKCPDCGSDLVIKHGRYGKFIGCSGYPKCKHIEPIEKPQDTGVECPECHKGHILKRKSRYGKIFYSCERYPDCTYALWNEPLAEPCPKCNWPILSVKTTETRGNDEVCPQEDCRFSEPCDPPPKPDGEDNEEA